MRYLIAFAVLAVAAAAPTPGGLVGGWGGGLGGWGGSLGGWGGGLGLGHGVSSVSLVQQPVVHSAPIISQPIVQSAPIVHAAPAVAIAKPAATSYSSFQQVVHPVSVAQPVVHAAPVISQPIVHAPVVQPQIISQPLVQSVHSAPIISSVGAYGQYGHGW